MISHRNLLANFQQITADYFLDYGKVAPPRTTTVSWLPFYHDLGLILGICAPILAGVRGVSISPVAFLQRPARWMQLLASNGRVFSSAPNFAFDLAARKTSDEDMAGLDLADVLILRTGSRAGAPGDAAAIHRAVQSFWSARQRDSTVVRTGRSDGVRGDPHTRSTTEDRPFRRRKTSHRPRRAVAVAAAQRWSATGSGVADGADRRSRHQH